MPLRKRWMAGLESLGEVLKWRSGILWLPEVYLLGLVFTLESNDPSLKVSRISCAAKTALLERVSKTIGAYQLGDKKAMLRLSE